MYKQRLFYYYCWKPEISSPGTAEKTKETKETKETNRMRQAEDAKRIPRNAQITPLCQTLSGDQEASWEQKSRVVFCTDTLYYYSI